MQDVNIVQLIEKNSITRLSGEYESKLINKVKETFSDTEQQIFLGSFYCFLNYDSKKHFVVDFDSVWKWCGFSRKSDGKRVLEKHFINEVDYKVEKAATATCGANIKNGKNIGGAGQNKEIILLTVNTFKKFCLKANTKKADEIHDYYIKLEELLQETINEETNELRLQLQNKEKDLLLKDEKLAEEKLMRKQLKAKYECFLLRRIDIDNKYKKGDCIYLVGFDEMPNKFKIGYTSNLKRRLSDYYTEVPYEPVLLYKQYVFFDFDIKIVEHTIHHMLRKFRTRNSKEWFQTDDKQIFINEIIDVIKFFENKDKQYENITDIKGNIVDVLNINKIKDTNEDDNEDDNEDTNEDDDNEDDDIEDLEEEKDEDLEEDTKKCSQCKIYKIKDEFAKNPTRKDGLDNNCKECHKENYELSKEKNKIIYEEKKCSKCDTVKNISKFYNRIGSSDGKTSECVDCSKMMYKKRFEARKGNSLNTEITEKTCKDCNMLLHINNFSKKTDSIDGYNYVCKSCISKKVKEKKETVKETPETKCCNTCNKVLDITCFWNCKSNKDGKNNRCSDCCKEKRKDKK